MMKARTFGAAALAVLSIAVGACERSDVNGIGSNTPNEDAPPQLDLIGVIDCSVGEWGWVSGGGDIHNGAPDVSTYEVVVGFYDDDRRLGEKRTWIRDVDPGESARFETHVWLNDDATAMTSCEVVTINRWSVRLQR